MNENKNQKASLSRFVVHTAIITTLLISLELIFDIFFIIYVFIILIAGGAYLAQLLSKRASSKERYAILVWGTSTLLAIIFIFIKFHMTGK
jgi:hypothetical protein